MNDQKLLVIDKNVKAVFDNDFFWIKLTKEKINGIEN
jgi:hypothetical protein